MIIWPSPHLPHQMDMNKSIRHKFQVMTQHFNQRKRSSWTIDHYSSHDHDMTSLILLIEEILHQLICSLSRPIIYRVLHIPGGARVSGQLTSLYPRWAFMMKEKHLCSSVMYLGSLRIGALSWATFFVFLNIGLYWCSLELPSSNARDIQWFIITCFGPFGLRLYCMEHPLKEL